MPASTRRYFYEPKAPLTAELVRSVLELVERRVDPATVEKWTDLELLVAYDWATRVHLSASDNPIRYRPEPWFVKVAVTARPNPSGLLDVMQGVSVDPAHLASLGIVPETIQLANYRAKCPAGEWIVARVWDRNSRISYLTEGGEICDHGFVPPERHWVGPQEPS